MKKIYSTRAFRCMWIEDGEHFNIAVDINSIHNREEHENDFEYNYALQDRIDEVLDLKVGETMFFQFNRDDANTKGIVHRVK